MPSPLKPKLKTRRSTPAGIRTQTEILGLPLTEKEGADRYWTFTLVATPDEILRSTILLLRKPLDFLGDVFGRADVQSKAGLQKISSVFNPNLPITINFHYGYDGDRSGLEANEEIYLFHGEYGTNTIKAFFPKIYSRGITPSTTKRHIDSTVFRPDVDLFFELLKSGSDDKIADITAIDSANTVFTHFDLEMVRDGTDNIFNRYKRRIQVLNLENIIREGPKYFGDNAIDKVFHFCYAQMICDPWLEIDVLNRCIIEQKARMQVYDGASLVSWPEGLEVRFQRCLESNLTYSYVVPPDSPDGAPNRNSPEVKLMEADPCSKSYGQFIDPGPEYHPICLSNGSVIGWRYIGG